VRALAAASGMNLLAAWVTLKQLHGRPKLGMVAIELYLNGYLTTVTVAQQHTRATLPLTATHSNIKQQINTTQAPSSSTGYSLLHMYHQLQKTARHHQYAAGAMITHILAAQLHRNKNTVRQCQPQQNQLKDCQQQGTLPSLFCVLTRFDNPRNQHMQWASLAEQPNLSNAGNKKGPESRL
jgi:hypothetical protein